MPLSDEIKGRAIAAAAKIDADVFFYNGNLLTGPDLQFVEQVEAAKNKPNAVLFLTTYGGDPDAAYKIARYFQESYGKFTLVVAGKCKSAGTLLAVGAHEIAFTPYGELGPLDIQLSKVDKFDHLESGLAIQDSLQTLQNRAMQEYGQMIAGFIKSNNGLLSFALATEAACKFVTSLYAPVLSRIDPEELGARARSMRIASDYGKRLAARSDNLARADTLKTLAESYPSHSFVIDQQEATGLFRNVRSASDDELAVINVLGSHARFETSRTGEVIFHALSSPPSPPDKQEESSHDRPEKRGSQAQDARNPPRADGKTVPPDARPRGRRDAGKSSGTGRIPVRGNGTARSG